MEHQIIMAPKSKAPPAAKAKTARSTVTPVSVRFEPHVKEAIERAAKADVRPVATWVEKLVIESMKAKGLLKDDD
jgi:hypothetical protein